MKYLDPTAGLALTTVEKQWKYMYSLIHTCTTLYKVRAYLRLTFFLIYQSGEKKGNKSKLQI